MTVDILKLIISIVLCQAAGGVGAIFNLKSIPKWYMHLKKPSFNPPNWLFGPVWTILYLMMGISLYFVWVSGVSLISLPLIVFFGQLVLNVLWSVLFFGARKPFIAFVEIIFLLISIGAVVILFYPYSHLAAYLLIPYILWVMFASVLNFELWRLNRPRE
jgi:benzodiazapine receptor